MAKTPAAVRELLQAVWPAAVKRAGEERDALQEQVRAEGGNFAIAAWDWRYYAEKERKARYDVDEAATRPYLALDSVIAAAFDTARRLFGLRFKELPDAPRYHPDVRVWEVTDERGAHVGLFMGDYFARALQALGRLDVELPLAGEGCRPGAAHHRQRDELRAAARRASRRYCRSMTRARCSTSSGTACMGCLSDVTYPSISGTAVARDFVELPSQLYEHWLMAPDVLKRFAVHHKTGKPMPAKLAQRVEKARNFNQGFSTVEYVASALVDMELHALADGGDLDVAVFERETLAKARHAARDRHAPPEPALPAHRRRLCGGLLQLPVVGGDGCRRVRGLQGGGRSVPCGNREEAQEIHLRRRQRARSACRLRGVPRARAGDRRHAEKARAGELDFLSPCPSRHGEREKRA